MRGQVPGKFELWCCEELIELPRCQAPSQRQNHADDQSQALKSVPTSKLLDIEYVEVLSSQGAYCQISRYERWWYIVVSVEITQRQGSNLANVK